MSRFSDRLASHEAAASNTQNAADAANDLVVLLASISSNPEGARPADYLEPDIARMLEDEFLPEAEARDWPNAEELELKVALGGISRLGLPHANFRRRGRLPQDEVWLWRNRNQYPPRHDEKPTLLKRAWEGVGYHVGKLAFEWGRSRVVICDDGALRCERDPHIFSASAGYGYGQLPDPDVAPLVLVPNFEDVLAKYLIPTEPTVPGKNYL